MTTRTESSASSNRSRRLEARVDPELYELARRAAELQFSSLTEFIVSALREKALRTLKDSAVLDLALEDQVLFANALAEPPAPNAALKRAFDHRKRLLGLA